VGEERLPAVAPGNPFGKTLGRVHIVPGLEISRKHACDTVAGNSATRFMGAKARDSAPVGHTP
jgi:hypothetical protein